MVRVNPRTGAKSEFIAQVSATPASIFQLAGFEEPVDVKFRGNTMYVVDLGAFGPGIGMEGFGTGRVWVVTRNRR
jgi:hypothetical protein